MFDANAARNLSVAPTVAKRLNAEAKKRIQEKIVDEQKSKKLAGRLLRVTIRDIKRRATGCYRSLYCGLYDRGRHEDQIALMAYRLVMEMLESRGFSTSGDPHNGEASDISDFESHHGWTISW